MNNFNIQLIRLINDTFSFVLNNIHKENENNCISIIWFLIGSYIPNDNNECRRHEYPKVVEKYFSEPEKLIINYNGEKIKQYIIQIDPMYNKYPSIYPKKFQEINDEWKYITNGINELYFKKCNLKMGINDYYCVYSQYISFLETINQFKNNDDDNNNFLLGLFDFTSRTIDFTNIEKRKFWTGPSNCLADISQPIYMPVSEIIIENSKRKINWRYIKDHEYNQSYLQSNYSFEISSNLIQTILWKEIQENLISCIDILKITYLNDKFRYNNEKPNYYLNNKNEKDLLNLTEHIKYRCLSKKEIFIIENIVNEWIESKIDSLRIFINNKMNKIILKMNKLVYIDESMIYNKITKIRNKDNQHIDDYENDYENYYDNYDNNNYDNDNDNYNNKKIKFYNKIVKELSKDLKIDI